MTNTVMIYATMSSAKRGALRANLANPVFTKTDNGKIQVTEAKVETKKVRIKVSTKETPVAVFKELFEANYGTLRRSEIIKAAVEAGIAKNTAATYYQKLHAAKK